MNKEKLIEEVLFQFSRHIKGDIHLNQLEVEIQDAIHRFTYPTPSVPKEKDMDVYVFSRRGNWYGIFLTAEYAEKWRQLKMDEEEDVRYMSVKGEVVQMKLSQIIRNLLLNKEKE